MMALYDLGLAMISVTVIICNIDLITHILKDDCRLQYLHFDSVRGVLHPLSQIPCSFWPPYSHNMGEYLYLDPSDYVT